MKILINSQITLKKAQDELARVFDKNKYLSIKIETCKRSIAQNALQFAIYRELEQQGDQTSGEYRNYCKYHFGLHLRASEDKEFAELMRGPLMGHTYENRLKMMSFIDVTSTFNRQQMTEYLNQIYNHFEPQGFRLTRES